MSLKTITNNYFGNSQNICNIMIGVMLYYVATKAQAYVYYEIDNIACDFGPGMAKSNCCR